MSRLLASSLVLVPAAIAARLLDVAPVAVFAVGCLALVPLAGVITKATEQAGRHTGPALGGLLNATFANVPEVMIALFALSHGLFDVVRGSLTGSVLGNLLLVLGLTLFVAGDRQLDRTAVLPSLALLAFAVPVLALAAAPYLAGADEDEARAVLAFPLAAVLVLAYAAVVVSELRASSSQEPGDAPEWSLRRAVLVLAAATATTAAVAETITGSIDAFSEALGVPQLFTAAIIVALAGNAAEHGAAIVLAARGEVKLGADIAIESAAQVAALAIPVVAVASWLVEPLPLAFTPVELAALAGAVALSGGLLVRCRSSRPRGAVLIAAYAVAALLFLFLGS